MNSIIFENREVFPSKVVCVGRNYVEHIEELGNEMPSQMVLFNKPNSSITNELKYFSPTHRYEGEISFLIRKNQIVGVGVGLDLTDKDAQEYAKSKGLPWERAKAFDKSAVFSKFVSIDLDSMERLKMELYINSLLTQVATIDLMIYKPEIIVAEIQSFMTLEDNDIIMTGTPKGVGAYKRGDHFVIKLLSGNDILLEHKWIAQKDYK